MAHDLGDLLAIGDAELDSLERDLAGGLGERIARIRAAVARARRMVAAIDRPGRPGAERVIDLGAAVSAAIALLATAAGPSVAVVLEPTKTALPIRIDPEEPDAVLRALVLNARAAMPEGGRIVIATSRDDGDAVLAVVDSGPGMAAERVARATEPGFTRGPGRGLGLALAAESAVPSGGRIDLAGRPGHGTRVALRLPLARPEAVLLIEPEPERRKAAAQALTAAGHRVVEAEDAAAAARALGALIIDRVGGADDGEEAR